MPDAPHPESSTCCEPPAQVPCSAQVHRQTLGRAYGKSRKKCPHVPTILRQRRVGAQTSMHEDHHRDDWSRRTELVQGIPSHSLVRFARGQRQRPTSWDRAALATALNEAACMPRQHRCSRQTGRSTSIHWNIPLRPFYGCSIVNVYIHFPPT